MLMPHQSNSVSKHKLSWGSWVSLLDSSVLCLYLSSEAPPTSCYHGDSPSWVSCLQRSEVFSVLKPVRKLELARRGIRVVTLVCSFVPRPCTVGSILPTMKLMSNYILHCNCHSPLCWLQVLVLACTSHAWIHVTCPQLLFVAMNTLVNCKYNLLPSLVPRPRPAWERGYLLPVSIVLLV